MKRVALFKDDPHEAIKAYTQGVTTVDPMKATGKPHLLWISFARFYEKHGDLKNARVIYHKAAEVNFKSVDALAAVWCSYGEMELKNCEYDRALKLLKEALVVPQGTGAGGKRGWEKLPVQHKD
jgi:pre-mRNA-splicing factor SYF1